MLGSESFCLIFICGTGFAFWRGIISFTVCNLPIVNFLIGGIVWLGCVELSFLSLNVWEELEILFLSKHLQIF